MKAASPARRGWEWEAAAGVEGPPLPLPPPPGELHACYSRLRELVPGIPRGSRVSPVELLQRVIDYIFDLQIVLQEPPPPPPPAAAPRQAAELAADLRAKEEPRRRGH